MRKQQGGNNGGLRSRDSEKEKMVLLEVKPTDTKNARVIHWRKL